MDITLLKEILVIKRQELTWFMMMRVMTAQTRQEQKQLLMDCTVRVFRFKRS